METQSRKSPLRHHLVMVPTYNVPVGRIFASLCVVGIVYVFFIYHIVLPASISRNPPDYQDVMRFKRTLVVNESYYMYGSPTTDTCYLRDKLSSPELPDLHSVFSDPMSGEVIFVGLKLLKHRWHEGPFRCEFSDGQMSETKQILEDRQSFGHFPQYVVVLTCPIPEPFRWRVRFKINLRRLAANTTYVNLTVCTSGASPEKLYKLAICTMVKNSDSFIPEWLDYHRFVGVEHVFIYDNELETKTTLPESLTDYIENGFVTIIPWAHSVSRFKTYLEVQIAHENDCVWRYKHNVHWMVKIDVDEYVQPMNEEKPYITDYINSTIFNNVASVRIQNWFFGHPPNFTHDSDSIIERNCWRSEQPTLQNTGHDKNILRPINVHYFKIHSVKLGGDVISADPYTELRLVHYREDNPRARHFSLPTFSERDDSMVRIRNESLLWRESRLSSSETEQTLTTTN
ncbi:uncharacterized protein [Asterias amurensis]|uniref:uncharacterized protein n=1 Tax=Asterias amurensis TaxID=7602 RepID=UPI003AB50A21